MTISLKTLSAALLGLSLFSADAQIGGVKGAAAEQNNPSLSGPTAKLFGSNVAYSATMEVKTGKSQAIVSQVFVDDGKARYEMDMAESMGKILPAEVTAELRRTGMGKSAHLWLPEKKAFYQIYPHTRAYLEMPMPFPEASKSESDSPVETTELGKESLDGHSCVKRKTVVTSPQGHKHEFIVWNATDLNSFPIKILQTTSLGEPQTTVYKNVKLAKPDPKLFELPTGYRKHTDLGTLMQDMMMKMLSGRH